MSICNIYALLRGREGKKSTAINLVLVRLYIFSLMWWPVYCVSVPLSTLFLCYLPFYIDLAEFNGWRKSDSVRSGQGLCGSLVAFLKNYFNCQLVKTEDINKQCIIGLHPHGIIPFAGSINICSEASNFSELYPALKSRVLVAASTCFLVPGFRDILLMHGVLDCSRFNCEKWLEDGHSVFVFPGGASEGLYANPGCDWLDINRRLGFIRLAIRYNIPVVPSYTFNEVDAFTQVNYSVIDNNYTIIHQLRKCFQKTVGIALPLFCQVIPNPNVSNIAVTVVGKPLKLPFQSEHPSDEQVRLCLQMYVDALVELYEKHAPKYNSSKRSLVLS